MHNHEEDWRSYPIESDDEMGFAMTDLGWTEAPHSHPWCVRLAIELNEPGPQGLGSTEEMESLSAGEDEFLEAAAQAQAIHVARVRHGGEVAWFFYAQSEDIVESLGQVAAELLQRDISAGAQHDPEWGVYASILPSPAVERWMADMQLIDTLEKHGDPLTVEREVIHYAYFDDLESAEAFAADSEPEGFEVEIREPDEEIEQFGVVLTQQSAVDMDTIGAITQTLSERAAELDGEYDGWECALVKGPGGSNN
ncbi:MAG: DUF695 domain-containing protein [Phycisphaeraceae bacterium]|nr:DUF695 domain-containing protein [Phycisphaeraceae bacterium]MBX3407376.1 DUF695 domain-containing protein [Phycisphaeraceae bacterium]